MSTYTKQAEDFLKETGTEFSCKFIGNRIYFHGDREYRRVYEITLDRKGVHKFVFTFGQSLLKSKSENPEPTPYDVLSCLQKYDVGGFKEFCSEFGYDENKIAHRRIYNAVCREWKNIKDLYNDEEIEKLQEIQ